MGKFNRWFCLAALFVLGLLGSACGRASSRTEAAPTETASPTNTKTPFRLPTATNIPTWTPLPTPNATQITQATRLEATYRSEQSSRQATQEMAGSLWEQFPPACDDLFRYSFSPDRNWVATLCGLTGSRLLVMNREETEYEIDPQEFLAGVDASTINFTFFTWSTDSQQLYFFMESCCKDGIGDYLPFGDMQPFPWNLYRLDVQDGATTLVIAGANAYSYSPTGRRLVYVVRLGHHCEDEPCWMEICILDLRTGEIVVHRLENYLAAGYFVWSEDGQNIYFSAVKNPSDYPESPQANWYAYDYSIFSIQVNEESIREIIKFQDSWSIIYPVGIQSDNLLLQFDTYNRDFRLTTDIHWLNLLTLELVPERASP